jgi:hypothetical protein
LPAPPRALAVARRPTWRATTSAHDAARRCRSTPTPTPAVLRRAHRLPRPPHRAQRHVTCRTASPSPRLDRRQVAQRRCSPRCCRTSLSASHT